MALADVSPPRASAGLPAGLDVPVALAWPGALVLAVWVVAKPHSSASGLVVLVEPARLSPPAVLAASAGLASHWAGLASVAQTPAEKPRAVSAAPCCNALVMESLGA